MKELFFFAIFIAVAIFILGSCVKEKRNIERGTLVTTTGDTLIINGGRMNTLYNGSITIKDFTIKGY